MKIYLAGRFSQRHTLNELGNFLQGLGHTITSRWTLPGEDHITPAGLSKQAADEDRRRFAMEDLEDIDNCDWMISLMDKPRGNGRGGRHVEFGYALAKGKKLAIIGMRETVFHHLDGIPVFVSIESFKHYMQFVAIPMSKEI